MAEDIDVGALADEIVSRLVEMFAPTLKEMEQRVTSRPPEDGTMLDARQVAEQFGFSRSWVYENARKLGAIRVGEGPRPRLRFDAALVAERLASCSAARGSRGSENAATKPTSARTRTKPLGTRPDLLPIGGGSSRSEALRDLEDTTERRSHG